MSRPRTRAGDTSLVPLRVLPHLGGTGWANTSPVRCPQPVVLRPEACPAHEVSEALAALLCAGETSHAPGEDPRGHTPPDLIARPASEKVQVLCKKQRAIGPWFFKTRLDKVAYSLL